MYIIQSYKLKWTYENEQNIYRNVRNGDKIKLAKKQMDKECGGEYEEKIGIQPWQRGGRKKEGGKPYTRTRPGKMLKANTNEGQVT